MPTLSDDELLEAARLASVAGMPAQQVAEPVQNAPNEPQRTTVGGESSGAPVSYSALELANRRYPSGELHMPPALVPTADRTTMPAPAIEPSVPPPALEVGHAGFGELFARGEHRGALAAALARLALCPSDGTAARIATQSEEAIVARLYEQLGAPSRVPALAADAQALDPHEAFLFHHIDGFSDIETLVDSAGMNRVEVLDRLLALLQRGAITLG